MAIDSSQISEREREILRLVAMGATNQQIANRLNISVNTVKVHLRNIFGKIGAASRTEATVYAIRQGLVSVDGSALTAAAELPGATVELPPTVATELPPPDTATSAGEAASAPVVPIALEADQEQTLRGPRAIGTPGQAPAHNRRLLVALAAICIILAAALAYTLVRQRQSDQTSPTPEPAGFASDRWKSHAPLAQPRSEFAVAAHEGKLYVIGGAGPGGASAAVDRYDPANDLWVSLTDKPTAAAQVQAVTVGGRIYVPGGEDRNGKPLQTLEAYDPRNQQWETLPPLPAPRSRYALATIEGRIYLFGGWDGSNYRAEVFAYDPETKSWSTRAPLPTPRRNAGAAAVEERVYVIGGENASGALRSNERYDPTSGRDGRWDSRTPLPAAVAAPAVAGIGSAGAWVFDPRLRSGLQYDPNKDAWTSLDIREGIALSTRVVPLSTSLFVFGPAGDGTQPVAFSEYKALLTIFIPNAGSGTH